MGVLFHGDRNGDRNILLRYLSPSLQALKANGRKEENQLSTKLVRCGLYPFTHRESLWVLSVCCHTPVFICQQYDKFLQVKNKAQLSVIL